MTVQNDISSHLEIQGFIDAWRSIKQDQPVPLRSNVDPVVFKPYLRTMLITELDGGDLIYRLVGTAIDTTNGNMLGTSAFDYMPDALAKTARSMFQTAAKHPCGWFSEYLVPLETDEFANRYATHLPLIDERSSNPFFVGYVHFVDEYVSTPLMPAAKQLSKVEFQLQKTAFLDIGCGIPDTG